MGDKQQIQQKQHGQIKLADEQESLGLVALAVSKGGQHGSGKTAPQVSPLRHRPGDHRRPLQKVLRGADAPGPDAAPGKERGPAGPERPVAGAEGVGQTMLMLLSPEGELVIACWMCRQSFQDRHALRRHETSAHLSHCAKCGSRHSGKCAAEPLSVQDQDQARNTLWTGRT